MYCDCHAIVSVTPPLWNLKLWPKMMEVVMLEYLPLGTNDRERNHYSWKNIKEEWSAMAKALEVNETLHSVPRLFNCGA